MIGTFLGCTRPSAGDDAADDTARSDTGGQFDPTSPLVVHINDPDNEAGEVTVSANAATLLVDCAYGSDMDGNDQSSISTYTYANDDETAWGVKLCVGHPAVGEFDYEGGDCYARPSTSADILNLEPTQAVVGPEDGTMTVTEHEQGVGIAGSFAYEYELTGRTVTATGDFDLTCSG